MAINKVEICGVDTSTLPVLTNERMRELFPLVHSGDLNALDNFDTTLNVRFSTYAVPMIIGEIRRYLRDNNAIRVSRSLRDIAYKALKARDQLSEKLGREPNVNELAEALHLPREDVVFALEAIQDPVSLFEPVFNDGGDSLYIMDQITNERKPDNGWLDEIGVQDAMSRLNERERHILKLRFYQGRTQMEVASEIGISQAQVSRLEKNALVHMRKNMGL